MTWVVGQGCPVEKAGAASFPSCFLQFFGLPIDSAGRKALHLPDSVASLQHNRNTPFSAVYLEAAFHLCCPTMYLFLRCPVASWLLLGVCRCLCLVVRPKIHLILRHRCLGPVCSPLLPQIYH